ncbi:5-carboxymethyl-2-hydroxymuconate Delta-isomerase [Aquabacterium sp. OR-4]|uniref:5-carboxymethyl-2-hydroxymuconate Delta-isomerase n=1 Tax=Aquabacterium sp. OR-4 TaxID=2978127 RepID=UPI0021B24234|nr:5-carboxymethyl-2-hydroxymuconate Delta-isomerase [Aquabacterium sp. OR-4]MDT7838400.1 5-carboxymethyl-2-hydroxymuconate Delta-isomerase [Aquabacterium sp. OR-4]
MPHLVICYTPNLEAETDLSALCRTMADAMLTVRDEAGQPVFPTGGTRVLAYPAAHFAVADGSGDFAFCYFNLRMGRGRSAATQQAAGQALTEAARAHLAPVLARRAVGLTLQIDEGAEVFDGKFGNLHDVFAKKTP